MPDPLNITNIIAPRVPFLDPKTGLISREWYRFLINLFYMAGSGGSSQTLEDLQKSPPPLDLTALAAETVPSSPPLPDLAGPLGNTLQQAQLSYPTPAQIYEIARQAAQEAIGLSPPPPSGSVTSVAETFTGGIISVAGSPITTSGTFALTVAGTSGGVPYFSSSTGWASSAALAANAIVLGGGAGAAPASTTTGTGVVTALGVNTGSAGAFVVNGGALGTPSSGTLTNATGLVPSTGLAATGTPSSTTFLAGDNSWKAAGSGTVTSVAISGGVTGVSVSGSPVTTTGTITLAVAKTFGIGGATNAGTGSGITFPATQDASSDANTLDDYEEGTWTPGLSFGGGTTGIAYGGSNGANYIKIGRLVFVSGYLQLTSKGSSTGNVLLTGMPFTGSVTNASSATLGIYTGMSGTTATLALDLGNSTSASIYALPATLLTDANFTNTSAIEFNFCYRASA